MAPEMETPTQIKACWVIDRDVYEALRKRAFERRVSQASIVREILRKGLAAEGASSGPEKVDQS